MYVFMSFPWSVQKGYKSSACNKIRSMNWSQATLSYLMALLILFCASRWHQSGHLIYPPLACLLLPFLCKPFCNPPPCLLEVGPVLYPRSWCSPYFSLSMFICGRTFILPYTIMAYTILYIYIKCQDHSQNFYHYIWFFSNRGCTLFSWFNELC